MGKVPKNLSLDREAIRRGERYGRLHGTTLSRLVGDFLRSLPLEAAASLELSPVVRRLRGVAAGGRTDLKAYRDHLHRKYGRRRRSSTKR